MPAPENSELHAKVESLDLTPKDSTDALSALDSLMADEAKKSGATDADITAASTAKPVAAPAAVVPVSKDLDDSARLEQEAAAAATKEAADKVSADAATKDAADKAAKEAADKAAAADPAKPIEKKADEFDKIELPPHSSQKAGESFAAMKKAAREQIVALQTQLSDTNTKFTETTKALEEAQKNSGQLPENVKTELEELRRFKIAHDVESDPSFTKFKTQIESNHEAIYKKLQQAGYTEENIARIKELGGPDSVNWEPLLEKLPVQTKLFLQAKLVENINLADSKEAALEAAKANGQNFLKERAEKDSNELLSTANGHLKNLPWTAERQIPASATAEQRAEIEAANKEAKEALNTVKQYLSDRSPARHAELAIGTLLAHRLDRQNVALQAKLTASEAAHKTALETLTNERDTLKKELEAIKLAEIPRSEHQHTTITPAAKRGQFDARSGAEALDAHFAEIAAATR